jgi:microcin C transport system permease protein
MSDGPNRQDAPLLDVRDLSVVFDVGRGKSFTAVDRISFSLNRGETLALVDVVRAEFLRARNFDYVRAAKALGASDLVIMFKHVLPNAMVATLSMMPFILSGSMVQLSSLDFLGFGLPPGSPSLGEMITQGKNNLQAPWLGISAFAAIALMLSLLVFVGEAVRDAFDPRKTFR